MDHARLTAALEATWPPAERRADVPGWTLRRGLGGGKRVSAATRRGTGGDIDEAAAAMRAWAQAPLFRIDPDDEGDMALDAALAARGFAVVDPSILYAAPARDLAALETPEGVKTALVRARLALLDEIWDSGGVGPARRAVMARAPAPKTTIMARTDTAVAGVAFVAVSGEIAMIHAIEVRPEHRRKGGGRATLEGAARFALDNGAEALALAVTEENAPARALYARVGMTEAGRYHYRIAPDGENA